MDTLEQPVVPVDAPIDDPPPRDAPGPRHRAPIALRAFLGLVALGAGLTTVALLLSDRAPGVVRRVFGDTARELWARVDADRRAAIEATGATAEPDLVVHVAIWFVVTLLVSLTFWSWRGLAVAVALATAASVILEFGQRRWATTWAFETSDLVANLVGVALGAATAAAVIAAWAAIGTAVERRRERHGGRR